MEIKARKVALVAINSKFVHSSLAVWYLAAALPVYSRAGHEVRVFESTINRPQDELLREVLDFSPNVVGISVYIWNARQSESLLREIKKRAPLTAVAVGGPEAGCNAGYWRSIGADFVNEGAGEGPFARFCDALDPGGDSPRRRVDPYTDRYFQTLGGRIAYLQTSRGCPFSCAFCLSGGEKPVFFPLEEAKEQILRLSRSGTRTVKFVDRTFNCHEGRANEILQYVAALDTGCTFHFEVAADLFGRAALDLLKSAPPGRIQLEAGLQSFNRPTLDAVARHTSLQLAEQNLREIARFGNVHLHVDLIAGLPFEGLAQFAESFNRAFDIGAHMLQLGFLKVLHGTVMRERADEWGIEFDSRPPYEVRRTAWISSGELDVIRAAERGIEWAHNSGRFLLTVEYALRAGGVTAFELFCGLGRALPGHGAALEACALCAFEALKALPGIDETALKDAMICDWLAAMKGRNMPEFLKAGNKAAVSQAARRALGRAPARCECAALHGGGGVFVDWQARDPVTGRHALTRVP